MGQNLSRKTAAAKCIFLPYLNMSKKTEKNHAYRGRKVTIIVQISAHSELHNRNEKSYRAQIRGGIKSPNTNSNLFKPKRVKLGTLFRLY